MVFGIKNKFMLKLIIFIISVIIMIGSYSFVSALYISMFDITSHRSVGMIFISFYFLLIASPVLLITLFTRFRVSLRFYFVEYVIYSLNGTRCTLSELY